MMDKRTQEAVQKIVGVMLRELFRQTNQEWDHAWDAAIQVEGSMRGGTWTSPGFFNGISYGDWFHDIDKGTFTVTFTEER
jgi:hypothetical protein